jgi:hypothetical protein
MPSGLARCAPGGRLPLTTGRLPPAAGDLQAATAFAIEAINGCRENASLALEIMSLYDGLERELSGPGAVPARCLGGGTCCRFDRLGHRLWASCGEIALLLDGGHKAVGRAGTPTRGIAQNGLRVRTDALQRCRCPWQLGPRCLARQTRPLGCRAYFCQKQYENYFHEIYEKYHGLIQAAHQRHCVTYAYVDVLAAVIQLSAT